MRKDFGGSIDFAIAIAGAEAAQGKRMGIVADMSRPRTGENEAGEPEKPPARLGVQVHCSFIVFSTRPSLLARLLSFSSLPLLLAQPSTRSADLGTV